jgi:hypothetical protein
MTRPLPKYTEDESRQNWLVKYIAVQKVYDKQIMQALLDASVDAAAAAAKYEGKTNISSKVAMQQSRLVRNEIRKVILDLFKSMTPLIMAGQKDAAAAASKAAMEQDKDLMKILFPNANKRKQFQSSFEEAARQNIAAMVRRILNPQWPLSERVWKSGSLASGQIDRKINSAIARGASAKQLAQMVRSDVKFGAPGGTSYCAMRLARTEINNAFHAQSIANAQELPWVMEMEWHLSLSHKEQDCMCEYYADEQYFEINDVPPKPHPQCMCYVTPVSMGYDNFAEQLEAGSFDDYFEKKYGMPAA